MPYRRRSALRAIDFSSTQMTSLFPTLGRAVSAVALGLLLHGPVFSQTGQAPYPGMLTLQVDATDLDRRIFRVRETVPVVPGPLRLYYPQWLPGNHGPTGRIDELAGLKISAGGARLAWKRDPLDVYAFTLEVPAGASTLDIEFQHLSPIDRDSGRVVVTPEMLNVQWNAVLLYPAGHADRAITVKPSLRLPAGWKFGSALEAAAQQGATTEFKPVSVETLIDSPVFAGKHMARIDLDPDAAANGRPPIFLDVMADTPGELTMTAEQLAAHRALVTQADRLFGTRHFAHYDFLLAISDSLGEIGLEHHQSSENGVPPGYFSEWAKSSVGRDLLAHEFTHSWNGKFRRPADLSTPNTNTPMQDSLLWMYEGQTQFWGYVLAARAGLVPLAEMRDTLADSAAWLQAQQGRAWRNLQDTTNQAVMAWRTESGDWRDWQRGSDYYDEMVLVWLEADMLIRDASGGARSLDDFARAFFGAAPDRAGSDITPLTYRFDDVVAALNRIEPHDWAHFLRTRLDTHRGTALLRGLERSGWRLGWSDEPNSFTKGSAAQRRIDDFSYSLGFDVGKENALASVRWGSPAFAAGLSSSVRLIAVNGLAYKADRLKAAITEAKTGGAAIQLLVKDGDHYRTVPITYTGGLRYPKLERIEGTEDRLTQVLTARP
jgi:predicted metalloprotease with PDZ domain